MSEMELIQTPNSTSTPASASASASTKKHVRQPPSVPFLWEVKPGIPKKDWKPEFRSVSLVPAIPPVKLIASVPFQWEEKPGIPLPSFLEASQESGMKDYMYKFTDVDESLDEFWGAYDGYGDDEEEQSMSKLDREAFGSETDYSYSSVPSLLANCLVSSLAISTAVPEQDLSLTEDNGGLLESESLSSPSSETESSTSSYATGNSSLAGSSFLECLFPLFPPNSGFLGKVGNSEDTHKPPEFSNQKLDHESNGSVTVRRPPTLGELILMSRRRSCRRKAAQMRKQDLSMVNLTASYSTFYSH